MKRSTGTSGFSRNITKNVVVELEEEVGGWMVGKVYLGFNFKRFDSPWSSRKKSHSKHVSKVANLFERQKDSRFVLQKFRLEEWHEEDEDLWAAIPINLCVYLNEAPLEDFQINCNPLTLTISNQSQEQQQEGKASVLKQ